MRVWLHRSRTTGVSGEPAATATAQTQRRRSQPRKQQQQRRQRALRRASTTALRLPSHLPRAPSIAASVGLIQLPQPSKCQLVDLALLFIVSDADLVLGGRVDYLIVHPSGLYQQAGANGRDRTVPDSLDRDGKTVATESADLGLGVS